mmetsp:Transcript_17264/g.32743  ORF Transcript_17264/g.32743 Transcript_17264/m.32743 type:complete len:695 (+) Transcript_17264:279-2363(+)|eukprot:scaffold1000_cov166-Amphora_coffeaeformis.AAC.23
MSQKMTQSTTLSEDSLSDEGNVDRWGNPSSPGAFAESPIPEEASFLSSEGFQGDRIQVAVRFRPPSEDGANEDEGGKPLRKVLQPHLRSVHSTDKAWSIQESGPSINSALGTTSTVTQKGVVRKVPGRNVFAMDAVFDPDTETKSVYTDMVKPIVLSAANGQHGTVFVYGQTGSGKTFTMQGGDVDPFIGTKPKGIIQMAVADLFDRIESSGTRDWTIKASFFEVYNEEVRDLLVPDDGDSLSSICSHSCLPILSVREDSSGNVRVKAHEEVVTSEREVSRLLHKGNAHRACASTEKNSRSSRSHAIFRLSIESRPRLESDDESHMVRTSILNLVDLAGSENGSCTTGVRKREGCKINQSLLALTRVIQSLGLPDKKRPKFIGYRDSKLTRILKPSLQGEACMSIICCASIARCDVDETRSTLKFAASAKLIKVNPTINEVSDTAVGRLKEELSSLKHALASLQERYRQREIEHRQVPILREMPRMVTPAKSCVTSTPVASGHFVMETKKHVNNPLKAAASHLLERMEATDSDASEEGPVERESRSIGSGDGPPPPVREVAVLYESQQISPDRLAATEERARFLQEKLNSSYDVVAGLVQDLQQARSMIHQVHDQNLELQERMTSLEEEMNDRKAEGSSYSSWMMGVGVFLYAFELNQFVLAALMYMWLSKNFVAADVLEAPSEKKLDPMEDLV